MIFGDGDTDGDGVMGDGVMFGDGVIFGDGDTDGAGVISGDGGTVGAGVISGREAADVEIDEVMSDSVSHCSTRQIRIHVDDQDYQG